MAPVGLDVPDATATKAMTNVGVAAVSTAGIPDLNLGPLVVVADYANANTAVSDHYDRFLVGTVWQHLDGDGVYDPGEGKRGVLVSGDTASSYAVTAAGGGYAIPILEPGAIEVTFSGGGVPAHSASVDVGATSALLDYVVPEPGALVSGVAGAVVLAVARRRRLARRR